jgi:flagellar biosynthetic protein FliQ
MTPETVLDIGREALYLTMLLAGPLLLAALVVGLLIGIFQAATQIQEMTLSFIPKLAALVFALLIAGPWMLRLLMEFSTRLFISIPGMIG